MKKGYCILAAVFIALTSVAAIFFFTKNSRADDIAYRDATVEYGIFPTETAENAPVSAEVAVQYFDLDIGALAGGEPGTQGLQVDKILVSAGQQVREGTPLFQVTADSVREIRTVLQKEILDSSREYELLKARQKELSLQASQEYDNSIVAGRYAGMLYSDRRNALQEKTDDAKKTVDDKQNQVNENLLELTQTQQELVEAQKYLREAEVAVSENYRDRYDNAHYYTVYENTRETAQNMAGQLEGEVRSLTERNEALLYEVDETLRTYHQAVLNQAKENLTAKKEYDSRIYNSEMASEQYDIQMTRLETALQETAGRYEAALRGIRVFDAYIVRDRVLSGHNGTIAEISVKEGTYISKNDSLVTFYDAEPRERLHVPCNAVFREGERSYVKMRMENGDTIEKNVTTGFSDGVRTEIVDGLSEGDVVLEAVHCQ